MNIDKTLITNIENSLSAAIGQSVTLKSLKPLPGGCINDSFSFRAGDNGYFVKINTADRLYMFSAEQLALQEILDSKTIRAPQPLCSGKDDNNSWLIMDFQQLQSNGDHHLLGTQLAAMHKIRQPFYGWHRNNTIGSTVQINSRDDKWPSFFQQHRIAFQLELAESNGCSNDLISAGENLLTHLPDFFRTYHPQSSLLHGDLWGGNYAFTSNGCPLIFDPASYYGDREADIAMTELFGGFNPEFRAAYENAWPLDSGYTVRRTLYNCYHVINHFNLFGGGYERQAVDMINRILSERNA